MGKYQAGDKVTVRATITKVDGALLMMDVGGVDVGLFHNEKLIATHEPRAVHVGDWVEIAERGSLTGKVLCIDGSIAFLAWAGSNIMAKVENLTVKCPADADA